MSSNLKRDDRDIHHTKIGGAVKPERGRVGVCEAMTATGSNSHGSAERAYESSTNGVVQSRQHHFAEMVGEGGGGEVQGVM